MRCAQVLTNKYKRCRILFPYIWSFDKLRATLPASQRVLRARKKQQKRRRRRRRRNQKKKRRPNRTGQRTATAANPMRTWRERRQLSTRCVLRYPVIISVKRPIRTRCAACHYQECSSSLALRTYAKPIYNLHELGSVTIWYIT